MKKILLMSIVGLFILGAGSVFAIHDAETEIEVKIKDSKSWVEYDNAETGEEMNFWVESTVEDEIIDVVVEKTGLTEDEVSAIIEFELEESTEDEDEDEYEEEEGEEEDEDEDEDDDSDGYKKQEQTKEKTKSYNVENIIPIVNLILKTDNKELQDLLLAILIQIIKG